MKKTLKVSHHLIVSLFSALNLSETIKKRADPPSDQDVAAWVLHGNLSCLGCQYNMRGLVGPNVQCPECGHVNDLTKPELWETTELPLGVRERQHWPATAAFLSLFVLIATVACVQILIELGPIAVGSLIAFLVFLGFAIAWLWNCRRFTKSCMNPMWGVKILIGVHTGTWCLLWAGVFVFAPFNEITTVIFAKFLPAIIGVVAFFWTKYQITRGEDEAAYRVDWRKWRIPTGTPLDMTPSTNQEA